MWVPSSLLAYVMARVERRLMEADFTRYVHIVTAISGTGLNHQGCFIREGSASKICDDLGRSDHAFNGLRVVHIAHNGVDVGASKPLAELFELIFTAPSQSPLDGRRCLSRVLPRQVRRCELQHLGH